MYTKSWWEKRKDGKLFENISMNGMIILKILIKVMSGRASTMFMWLRIGISGYLL